MNITNKSLIFGGLLGLGILTRSYLFSNEEKNDLISKEINEEVKNDMVDSYGNFIEIDNDDVYTNDKNIKEVIIGKKKGYNILINSMYNYFANNKNYNFNDFLKKEWYDDYIIMINSCPGSSVNRDYNNWEKIFNNIKKKI